MKGQNTTFLGCGCGKVEISWQFHGNPCLVSGYIEPMTLLFCCPFQS